MAFTLKRLSEIFAVSGCEDEVRKFIETEIADKCDKIRIDSMGNIIALKRGKSSCKKIMLGTNIDEAGFIVSGITDDGYIKMKAVGAIDPRTLISKRVVIGKSHIKGVIGMKAIHVQEKSERENAVKLDALYIDIGENSKKKACKRVELGDYITFDTEYGEFGDSVKGKALDRMGVHCLIKAMEEIPAYDTYFVFSTQREIPCLIKGRGMRTASFKVRPDYALIVDTPDSGDVYKNSRPYAKLGGGVVIEYMDRTSISNTMFINAVKNLAVSKGIAVQDKMSSTDETIAGAAAQASDAAVTGVVGIPCRYSHTPVSIMNKKDIEAAAELCAAFVRESDVIIDGITEKID